MFQLGRIAKILIDFQPVEDMAGYPLLMDSQNFISSRDSVLQHDVSHMMP